MNLPEKTPLLMWGQFESLDKFIQEKDMESLEPRSGTQGAEQNPAVRHTPGPWSIPHFARPEVDCECGYVLHDEFMGAICTVHCSGEGDWKQTGDNPKFEQACANARLIAAAPDLLAALQEVEKNAPTNPVVLRIVRAALAKLR